MRICPPVSDFHKWLTAESERKTNACSILIHDQESSVDPHLVRKIADYLNEYDEEGEGCWLAATDDLVAHISADPFLRQLVGMESDMPSDGSAHTSTLSALASRGHVIARQPADLDWQVDAAHRFDVGLGEMLPQQCHMVLNPDKIRADHLAPLISDVFLEWLHFETVRPAFAGPPSGNPCATNEKIRKEA